jgi:N-acetyl-alpha-D-muramate 1-phosphate uridylyltransferase
MNAMLLAAGRGERMRPLSDHTPKPLLRAGGKRLIEYHLENLAAAGIHTVIINLGHLGAQIPAALGDGSRYGLALKYSPEPAGALETGGGIFNALPLLGDAPFLVINADIWCDYPLHCLPRLHHTWAHLVLIANPPHHPQGDFVLGHEGLLHLHGTPRLTFSGIGIYHPALFQECRPGAFPLAPLLRHAIEQGQVSGEYYSGHWYDVGTPQRLSLLDNMLRQD